MLGAIDAELAKLGVDENPAGGNPDALRRLRAWALSAPMATFSRGTVVAQIQSEMERAVVQEPANAQVERERALMMAAVRELAEMPYGLDAPSLRHNAAALTVRIASGAWQPEGVGDATPKLAAIREGRERRAGKPEASPERVAREEAASMALAEPDADDAFEDALLSAYSKVAGDIRDGVPVPSAPVYSIGSTVWPGISKLIEEMGEVQQLLGKLMGGGGTEHWQGDLRPKLIEELGDIVAATGFFTAHNFTSRERTAIADRAAKKLGVFDGWHSDPKPPAADAGGEKAGTTASKETT